MAGQCVILIAGPTGSGKSALALAAAERVRGCVVNADSMQVYRELSILTARPSAEDEARAAHRLYGHVPASEAYSVARYIDEGRAAIAAARAEGRVPIVTGGTGLYFKALLEGLAPVPAVPESVRTHWRQEGLRRGAEALHGVLSERDPVMAERLAPGDRQRIVRALEVFDATGRSLADWQRQPGEPVVREEKALRLVVTLERAELYRRCEARFEAMMAQGALLEAKRLAGLGLAPDLPAMGALGVRPLIAHIGGATSLDEAVTKAKVETRQYVKRQLTWLKSNMIAWTNILPQDMERNVAQIIKFIDLQP